MKKVEVYVGDIVGSDPDHHDKSDIAMKPATQNFWLPRAHKLCLHYSIVY